MTVDIRSSDPTLPRFGTDFIATVQSNHTNGALPSNPALPLKFEYLATP